MSGVKSLILEAVHTTNLHCVQPQRCGNAVLSDKMPWSQSCVQPAPAEKCRHLRVGVGVRVRVGVRSLQSWVRVRVGVGRVRLGLGLGLEVRVGVRVGVRVRG
jgi:hypothetical protein